MKPSQLWLTVREFPGLTLKELAFLLCCTYDQIKRKVREAVGAKILFRRKENKVWRIYTE